MHVSCRGQQFGEGYRQRPVYVERVGAQRPVEYSRQVQQMQMGLEAEQQARVRSAPQQQSLPQVRVNKAPQAQVSAASRHEQPRDSNRNAAAASPAMQYEAEGEAEDGDVYEAGERGDGELHVGQQLTVTHTATGDGANTSNLDGATLEDHSDAEEHELADDDPNARRPAPVQQQQQRAPAAYAQQSRGRSQQSPSAPADASDNEEGVVL